MAKTKRISKFLALMIVFAITLAIFPSLSLSVDAQTKTVGVDFTSGIYKYNLSQPLMHNPNTFEAEIKIDKNVSGEIGNLFSNESVSSSPFVGYSVNADGNMCVEWNSFEKYVVFKGVDLRTGNWEHVAVVRNKNTQSFALYLNGELKDEVFCGVGQDIEKFYQKHAIGGDFYSRQQVKRPFNGSVRQVTLYSDVLTAAEIKRDSINGDTISGKNRDNLIFNAIINPSTVVAYDTSIYGNDAYLSSNDYFYEDKTFDTKDYTLAVVPDIQCITQGYPAMVGTLTDYLVANANSKKIGATLTVGDLTNGVHSGVKTFDQQYSTIRKEFSKLNGVMPYVFVPGNHDYDDECKTNQNLTYFNKYLKIDEISKWQEWGGSYSSNSVVNAYYLMEFGGVKYIIFGLDFGPSDDVLEWCCEVTERYPDRRLIVCTHNILEGDGMMTNPTTGSAAQAYGFSKYVDVNSPQEMWDKWLKKYPNVFMTFCGHVISDDIQINQMVGDNGNVVSHFLVNGQGLLMNCGEESLVALLTFDEKNQVLYFNYYSTVQDKLYDFQNQFVYSFKGHTDILSDKYAEVSNATVETREQTLTAMAERTNLFKSSSLDVSDNNEYKATLIVVCVMAVLGAIALFMAKRKEAKNED